jgi:putative endonuclease
MSAASVYTVYILASRRHGTLYIGVTNNLRTRLEQHRAGRGSEFVKQYGVRHLVHVEEFAAPQDAIQREKQLKNWRRDWKIQLIEKDNGLERSVPPGLTPGVMGPGLRSQARLPGRRRALIQHFFHLSANQLSPSQRTSAAETARATAAIVAFCWSVEPDAPVR